MGPNAAHQDLELLRTIAEDRATDIRMRKQARAVLAWLETRNEAQAAEQAGVSRATLRKYVARFEQEGWQGLVQVPSPRGGDFLARYDQGYWAERLARTCLDSSRRFRAIPYGTSRSEPFTDLQTFRAYAISEALLQAWSAGQRWKRPDLLILPRQVLRAEAGNDAWTPDLVHWDNDRCRPFLTQAVGGVEVETSLWQVSRATVPLSFTVKDEDLEALRAWARVSGLPLLILQVFYDEADLLPFRRLEFLTSTEAPPMQRVKAEIDRFTKKATYKVPLAEGMRLGSIPEPDVEGRIYKAPNGRVTVYGRLTGSQIEVDDPSALESILGSR